MGQLPKTNTENEDPRRIKEHHTGTTLKGSLEETQNIIKGAYQNRSEHKTLNEH